MTCSCSKTSGSRPWRTTMLPSSITRATPWRFGPRPYACSSSRSAEQTMSLLASSPESQRLAVCQPSPLLSLTALRCSSPTKGRGDRQACQRLAHRLFEDLLRAFQVAVGSLCPFPMLVQPCKLLSQVQRCLAACRVATSQPHLVCRHGPVHGCWPSLAACLLPRQDELKELDLEIINLTVLPHSVCCSPQR